MDDIMRMDDSLASSQYGYKLMQGLIEQKCLQCDLDKSSFIKTGNSKQRKAFQKELAESLLLLCDKPITS